MNIDLSLALELAAPIATSALVIGALRADLRTLKATLREIEEGAKKLTDKVEEALRGIAVHASELSGIKERVGKTEDRLKAVEDGRVEDAKARHDQGEVLHRIIQRIDAISVGGAGSIMRQRPKRRAPKSPKRRPDAA